MGYNTKFDLDITDASGHYVSVPELRDEIQTAIKLDSLSARELAKYRSDYIAHARKVAKQLKDRQEIDYCLSACESGEPIKWYEHEGDCRALSKAFPGYLFEIRGAGEEAGDLWVRYYRNGKVQVAKATITYEPFNEKLLK